MNSVSSDWPLTLPCLFRKCTNLFRTCFCPLHTHRGESKSSRTGHFKRGFWLLRHTRTRLPGVSDSSDRVKEQTPHVLLKLDLNGNMLPWCSSIKCIFLFPKRKEELKGIWFSPQRQPQEFYSYFGLFYPDLLSVSPLPALMMRRYHQTLRSDVQSARVTVTVVDELHTTITMFHWLWPKVANWTVSLLQVHTGFHFRSSDRKPRRHAPE